MEEQKRPVRDGILLALMIILSILFLIPIFIVQMCIRDRTYCLCGRKHGRIRFGDNP